MAHLAQYTLLSLARCLHNPWWQTKEAQNEGHHESDFGSVDRLWSASSDSLRWARLRLRRHGYATVPLSVLGLLVASVEQAPYQPAEHQEEQSDR